MMTATKVLGTEQSDITKKYKLLEPIGQGTFGLVRKCQHRQTGEIYAVKTILKNKVPNLDLLKKEVDLLSEVNHPHIIKLYDAFEEPTKIHLVTELCTGGELYDRVVEKSLSPEGHFSEYDAARILRNILDAISYCHDEKHIVHRDLKVENFLLLHKGDEAPVKIIDFGLSRFTPENVMTSRVGTVYYVAPEVVLDDEYTNKCDVWSIGVIAYVLLCGFPPFHADNEFKTLQLVKEASLEFPSPIWDDVSHDARRFILRLLNRNPAERPTAKEALEDPWLQHEHVQPLGVSRRATFVPSQQQNKTRVHRSAPSQQHKQQNYQEYEDSDRVVRRASDRGAGRKDDDYHHSHQHPRSRVAATKSTTPTHGPHSYYVRNTAYATKSIQMKNRRREGFHRFLLRIKLRKQTSLEEEED